MSECEWFSVKERFPGPRHLCVLLIDGTDYAVGFGIVQMDTTIWFVYDYPTGAYTSLRKNDPQVTHWMKLPELPKRRKK